MRYWTQHYNISRIRFLIVDPNEHMRFLFLSVLHTLGVREVDLASSVAEALDLSETTKPDIIVTEIAMPQRDGISLIEAVRGGKAGIAAQTPIIVLSAYTEEANVKRARDAGMNEFLAKPVSARSLYDRIVRVIEGARPFVIAPLYRGPDRRRHEEEEPGAPFRRAKDTKGNAIAV